MDIAEKNLEMLIKNNNILLRESFGGNGGYYNGNACAGLNIYVDKFGNITYVGNKEETNYSLRVCLMKDKGVYHTEVVGIYRDIKNDGVVRITEVKEPQNQAEENLIKTMELYNKRMREKVTSSF